MKLKPIEKFPEHPVLYITNICKCVGEMEFFDKFNDRDTVLSVLLCREKDTKKSLGYGYIIYQDPSASAMAFTKLESRAWHSKFYCLELVQPDTPFAAGEGNILCEFSRRKRGTISNENPCKLTIAFRPSTWAFNNMVFPTFKQFAIISRPTTTQENIASLSSYGLLDSILTNSFAINENTYLPSRAENKKSPSLLKSAEPVTAKGVEKAAEPDRRDMICSYLYPLVTELYPDLACRITYILLSMHLEELLELMDKPEIFPVRAEQAMSFWTELKELYPDLVAAEGLI